MVIYLVIGLIIVLLVVLLIFVLRQRKKAKQQAAMAAQPDAAAPAGDEIALLIRDADAKLAAAKQEAGARVSTLPVFLIFGDAGCAKTSVMLHSGLDPELVAGQVYQSGNVTATRTANLWFSRHTVFAEVGGKLLPDTAKWKQLVSRLQPKASVVGKGEQAARAAIVCFDCENFTKPGALEMAATAARTLRARLGEISEAYGVNLPVYALFTKMDRLPFFTEYVRNLSNEEAQQVLGVTLPMAGVRAEGVYAEQETARLGGSFEGLFRSLADNRIEFLPRENDPSKLPAGYEFPREFRKVRQAAVQFLVDLCRPSQLTIGPFLRGFYFTGVRPVIVNESAPVQAAQPQQGGYGSAAGATGIFSVGGRAPAQPAAAPVATARKVPQWMFLGQLFTGVILADHTALSASGTSAKTSGARRWLLGIAASLCLIFVILFTISFFKNHSLETRVRDAAAAIGSGEGTGGDMASVDSLWRLETLRQSVEQLSDYHANGAPLMYRWGLYAGDDLYPSARKVYFARFKQLLFAQTQTADLQFLQGLPLTPTTDYQTTYDALKAYLITTSYHDKSTQQFLSPVLMKWWLNGRTADAERTQLAQKQFDFYSTELIAANPYSNDNDAPTIEKARKYLSLFAGTDRVYAFMLAEASKANPPIDFNKMFPGSAQTVLETHVVSGAFSKGGWAFMKDAIAHADRFFNGEKWVLGDYGAANIDRVKLAADLRARYNTDFTNEWRLYMKSGAVSRYSSIKDASTKLLALSGNQSPLLELISVASTNTGVDDPAVAQLFQPPQSVVPPGADKYIGGPNQGYMGALAALQSSLDAIANTPGQPSDQAAAPALGNAQQATAAARQIGQGFRPDKDGHVDSYTQKLLEDPITYVNGLLRTLGPAELNAKGADLCAQVRPTMAKFPFNPNGTVQATVQDFNTVFAPATGTLWQFYNTNLQKLLTKQGPTFVATGAAGMTITPQFLAMMNRAAAFTDAAYANGATDPHFTYTVAPVMNSGEDDIKMTIDGKTAEFTPATQTPQSFVWPGAAHGVQMSVRFKGGTPYAYPSYDGLWAIFQFVQDADRHTGTLVEMMLKAGKQGKTVNNEATGQPVTLRFQINANPPIFDKGYFAGMACVAQIAKP